MLVDRAGDQFLAGAAFAEHQHGDVLRRDPADRLVDLLHRGTAADEHVGAVGIAADRRFGNERRHTHEPADGERLVDQLTQRLDVERFEQEVEGAELHRLDGLIGRAEAGDEQHRHPRIDLPQLAVRRQTGLVGKIDIEDDRIGVVLCDEGEPFRGGRCGQQLHVGRAEDAAEGVQDGGFIIDDKERGHGPLQGQNPKLEYRNPKQIQNPNSSNNAHFSVIWIWEFGFVSDFDIRISDFCQRQAQDQARPPLQHVHRP